MDISTINVHGIFEVDIEMENTPHFFITILKILFGLLPVIYFTVSFYHRGQSIGKFLLRIKVVSLYHERIGLWHCIERSLGYFASAVEFGFGFIQFCGRRSVENPGGFPGRILEDNFEVWLIVIVTT